MKFTSFQAQQKVLYAVYYDFEWYFTDVVHSPAAVRYNIVDISSDANIKVICSGDDDDISETLRKFVKPFFRWFNNLLRFSLK